MSKRKRDEAAGVDNATLSLKSHDQKLVEERLRIVIEDGVRDLSRVLKIAQSFEKQKLEKRQKRTLEKKRSAELSRLKEEVEVLQRLNLDVAAKFYVYRTLTKIKSIATCPELPPDILARGKGPSPYYEANGSSAAMNVTARLYSSNLAREVIPAVIRKVREVLGIEAGKKQSEKSVGTSKGSVGKGSAKSLPDSKKPMGLRDSRTVDDAKSGGSDADSQYLKQYESRLADSSSERGSDPEDEIISQEVDEGPELAYGNDSQPSGLNEPPEKPTSKPRKKKKEPDKPPIKATTFLPSLAMGGYWSGSESEPNTSDEEAAKIQPTKNRRGQRARQAIWEQKFGSGANHVKKHEHSRDNGWDARKGAKSRDGDRRSQVRSKPQTRVSDRGKSVLPTGANSDPVNANINRKGGGIAQDSKKLHPSWEAARKQKEEKKAVAFQGKKVVFD